MPANVVFVEARILMLKLTVRIGDREMTYEGDTVEQVMELQRAAACPPPPLNVGSVATEAADRYVQPSGAEDKASLVYPNPHFSDYAVRGNVVMIRGWLRDVVARENAYAVALDRRRIINGVREIGTGITPHLMQMLVNEDHLP